MKKISRKFFALILSLLTAIGPMTTPAFAMEAIVPGDPGSMTERFIDESTSRELAAPVTSKSTWVKDAPEIDGYEFESFSQTTDHIYSQEEITYIVGYPDKTVRGERSLTRSEAVAIFYRLYNGAYPAPKQHMTEKTFSDVPATAWYYDELETCYAADIISGVEGDKFRPHDPITRAEFAAMASAFAELPHTDNAPFRDVSKSHWAYDDINSAAEAGWIVGYTDGTFRPENEISRAETVTLINRLRNRSITAKELRALGVQNPYTDLRESYWAYGDLIEATVKHNAADWHKLNYNEDNINIVVERFVDAEGNELAEPVTTKGQVNRAPREFANRRYLGYATEITYVYHEGRSVLTGSKDVDKAEAKVGDTLNYSITVGNDESANATLHNVVVSDTLPEHLGFVYGSVLVDGENSSYKYDVKSGLLTVQVGDLAPGENKQVTFAAIVKDSAYGETLSNTAILSADNNEDKPVTDEGTKVEDGKPGLIATKTVDKSAAKVGDTLTYTVTVSNSKEATAALENAVLTDTLPTYVDFVQGSVQVDGSTAHYGLEDGQMLVELGDIEPGANKVVKFQAVVNETAYNQTFQNTAVIGADNSDPVVPTDEGVTVEDGVADMTAEKSVDKDSASVGESLTYTVKISNTKDATVSLRDVNMSDIIPSGPDFTHGSIQVDGATAKYTYNSSTRELTVGLGEIEKGQSRTVTFEAAVNATAYGKVVKNTAILSAENHDDVTASTEAGTAIDDGKARMTATKSVDKAKAQVGDTLTYTITAANSDAATVALRNVVMTDTLPEYVTFNQGSVQVDGNSVHTNYDSETRQLTADMGEIEPGESKKLTFSAVVNSTAYGKKFTNTAVLSAGNSEDTPAQDTGVTVAAGTPEGSSGAKTVSKPKAAVGDTLTYSIAVRNSSTATAAWKNVKVTDVIPEHLSFIPGSVEVDGRSSNDYAYDADTHTLTLLADSIAIGRTKTYTFRVTVEDGAQGLYIVNTAKVASQGREDMQLPDTGVEIDGGRTEPGLTKTADVAKAKPGDTFTYTLEVKNGVNATADWKNVKITDTLPIGLELVPGTVTIDEKTVDYGMSGHVLTIDVGTLKPHEGKKITFQVKVLDGVAAGTIRNVATAKGSNGEKTTSDKGVEVEAGSAAPTMTKTASVKEAKPGDTFTYTLEIKNGAKATADWKNIVLSDVLPVGVELMGGTVTVDDKTTEYALAGQVLEVEIGTLKPNESVRVAFQVKVLERAAEDIIRNVATAQGDNGRRTASDNGVKVGLGRGELSGTKTVSQTTAKVGDVLTYTITAKNSDKVTSNLKDVIITDTLSEYLTLNPSSVLVDGLSARSFFDGAARQLHVELGDIAPGQTKTVTFTAAVNSNAYGKKFGNTAVITAKNGGPVTVTTPGAVTVEDGKAEGSVGAKTVDKSKAKVGDTLTYSIAVRNANTASGSWKNVEITDVIPEHLTFVSGSMEMNGRSTSDFSYNSGTRTLKLIADSVEPGQTKTFSFRVTVDEGAQGMYITNTAVAKSPDREDIQLPDTGVDIDGGKTEPTLTKSASKSEAKPGDIFTYTIKVKNGAKATADWKNVVVSDVIPAGLEFVSGSVRMDGQTVTYGISGRAIEVSAGDLKPNQEAVIEFDVRVLDNAQGTTITNTAIGKGDNGDKTGTDPGVTVPSPTPELTPVPTPAPTPDQPDKPSTPTPTPDNPGTNTPTPSDKQPTGTKTVDKTIVKPRETVTYTITATNTTDKVWSSVQATDTLDNSIMTLINDSITINGTKATADQWSFGGRDLVLNLGDIQPGSSVKAEFRVEFKTDASSKTFTNHATLKSPSHKDVDLTAPEVSITQDVTIPFTDIHYALYHGYGDSDGNPIYKWGPEDPITLTQVCHIAVRIMTDDYRKSLGKGTKTVPEAVKNKDAQFMISLGMVSPSEYPSDAEGKKPATQAQTYRILGAAFKRDFTSYITKADGQVSRIKLAIDLCDFTDRDTNPNRNGLVGRTFTDVGSYAALVAEVSNSHEYTKDSNGRETWIKNLDD